MKKPAPEASIELMLDEFLSEYGQELEITTTDDSGTKTELLVVKPWSDQEPPKEPEPS